MMPRSVALWVGVRTILQVDSGKASKVLLPPHDAFQFLIYMYILCRHVVLVV